MERLPLILMFFLRKSKYIWFLCSFLFLINEGFVGVGAPKVNENAKENYDIAVEKFYSGVQYRRENNIFKAIETYKEAITLFEIADSVSYLFAYCHINLGIANGVVSDFNGAFANYIEAEKLLLELNADDKVMGDHYYRTGRVLVSMGDHHRALDFFYRAYDLLKNVPQSDNQRLIERIAEQYYFTDDFEQALQYSNTKLLQPDLHSSSLLRFVKGNSLSKLQRYEEANMVYEEAYRLVLRNIDAGKTQQAELLLLMAHNWIRAQQFEKAELILKNLESNWNDANNASWLAYKYEVNGLLFLKKAEMESRKPIKDSLLLRGIDIFLAGLKTNTSDEQIPYLQKEKGVFDVPIMVVDFFGYIASAYHDLAINEKKYGEETKYYEALLEELHVYQSLIRYIHDYRISFNSEASRLQLSSNQRKAFVKSCEVAFRLYQKTENYKYIEDLFRTSESGKAASFMAALQGVKALKFGGIPDSILFEEKRLTNKVTHYRDLINRWNPNDANAIDSLEEKLFESQRSYDNLIVDLETSFPEYYDFKYANRVITPRELQKNLKTGQVLVEYVLGKIDGNNYSLTILAFTRDTSMIHVESIAAEVFDQNFFNFHRLLVDANFDETGMEEYRSYVQSGYYLYQKLLEPVLLQMEANDLIIVPDGKLANIPFEALLLGETQSENLDFRNLDYLIKKYSISYSYSASLLYNYFHDTKKSNRRVLAVAPKYSGEEVDINQAAYRNRLHPRSGLMPLPGAMDEVRFLNGLFKTDTLINEEACESTFKSIADQYDILHFAMHALVNDSLPMFSKLVFSGDEGENDGYLNTLEIYNLELNARLAVLSACNSGTGKLQDGEGVMSLSRAFLYAGCPSVVMTLWEVDDKSGSGVMKHFYEQLKKGYTKSKALQLAKIQHIENADMLKSHPYFWLPYIQIGNNEPIRNRLIYVYITGFCAFVLWLFFELVIKRRSKSNKHKF